MTSTMSKRLVTYQQVWSKPGTDNYEYLCTWSDGSETREFTLPWGRMAGAVEVGPYHPVTLEAAMDSFNAAVLAPYQMGTRQ